MTNKIKFCHTSKKHSTCTEFENYNLDTKLWKWYFAKTIHLNVFTFFFDKWLFFLPILSFLLILVNVYWISYKNDHSIWILMIFSHKLILQRSRDTLYKKNKKRQQNKYLQSDCGYVYSWNSYQGQRDLPSYPRQVLSKIELSISSVFQKSKPYFTNLDFF